MAIVYVYCVNLWAFVSIISKYWYKIDFLTNTWSFFENHTIFITPVVALVMILELITSVIVIFKPPNGLHNWMPVVGIILLGVIWISTAFVQIRLHNLLSYKFDENVILILINTNWIRTICWSIRGVIVLIMLDKLIKYPSKLKSQ